MKAEIELRRLSTLQFLTRKVLLIGGYLPREGESIAYADGWCAGKVDWVCWEWDLGMVTIQIINPFTTEEWLDLAKIWQPMEGFTCDQETEKLLKEGRHEASSQAD